jgi:hypothetical protein
MNLVDETALGGGSIVGLANSKEKCYALTAKGSMHSVEVLQPFKT